MSSLRRVFWVFSWLVVGFWAGASEYSPELAAFFAEAEETMLAMNPERAAYRGNDLRPREWTDDSLEARLKRLAAQLELLQRMKTQFDYGSLSDSDQLSYDLFEMSVKREIEGEKWRKYWYPVNQMSGSHTGIVTFLSNIHRVNSMEDADNYLARLEGIPNKLEEVLASMRRSEEAGVVPPRFVFPLVIEACEKVISGAPFDDEGEASPLLADFQRKLERVEKMRPEVRAGFEAAASRILIGSVKPAYESLIALLREQESRATDDAGVWKFPDGDAYYAYRLELMTTTDLTAEEIHAIGLAETTRLHDEMRKIMAQVGFEGTLLEFFNFMREDDQFYEPNTEEGRAAYLAQAVFYVDRMRERLPEMFNVFPKAPLEVRAVESYRESSAGKAFYSRPSVDGARPGYYYVNLKDLRLMPTYQLEALSAHEGIPGHHMQLAIAQELENIPDFRRSLRATAYTEGWGLYSELLPKELGYYEDPYSDFGHLALQLWRAARLVVDTGLHDLKWTREEAIDWLIVNTPNPEGDCRNAINRYIVYPGQATAYMIGRMKIQELRRKAEAALGRNFDLAEFHDVILRDGALPLDFLEAQVNQWLESKTAATETAEHTEAVDESPEAA
jgi:uncharacterized protein (DUF885 family)